ncbi:MAG TPA: DMT family transporter, partial [Candidatus Polarisedimenticolia bacterium]
YAPAAAGTMSGDRRWIPLSFAALLAWGFSSTLVKAAYRLPGADEINMLVFNTLGAFLTLGIYGLRHGRQGVHDRREWTRSFVPMGMLAGGDIGFIVATRYGPVSLTTPLSGAYPIVTVLFARLVLNERTTLGQGFCIGAILGGMAIASSAG